MSKDLDHNTTHARVVRLPRGFVQSARLFSACTLAALWLTPMLAHAGEGPAAEPAPAVEAHAPPAPVMPTAAPTLTPVNEGGTAAHVPPPPQLDQKLSMQGQAIWDGLHDQQVRLGMADGSSVSGTVVTHSATDIALARASDGLVVSVPKAEVKSVKSIGRRSAVVSSGPPPVDQNLSLRGSGIWDGLYDQRVRLGMADGSLVSGTVITHNASEVAIARESDGLVVSVPKTAVKSVNMRPQLPVRSSGQNMRARENRKLRTAGIALLSVGVPFAFSGMVMLGVCPGCLYIHMPLLLPGAGLIIGGAVALKRAKKRKLALGDTGRLQLTPAFGFRRNGGEVGFTLRF